MSKRKIKEPRDEKKKVGIYEQIDHPLFSFKYLQEDSINKYGKSENKKEGGEPYFKFLMRLKKLFLHSLRPMWKLFMCFDPRETIPHWSGGRWKKSFTSSTSNSDTVRSTPTLKKARRKP